MGLVGPLVGGIVGGLGVTSASVASALWQREAFVQTVANKCDLMSVLQSLAPIYHVLIHVTLFPSSHRRGQKDSLASGWQWVRRELTPGIYENIKSPQIGQIPFTLCTILNLVMVYSVHNLSNGSCKIRYMINVPRGQKAQNVKSVECWGKVPFSKNKSKVTKTFLFFRHMFAL